MVAHLIRIGALAALIIACTFLPFLPGPYDGMAVTLSGMALMGGTAGLLLVPVGALWLIYESSKRTLKRKRPSYQDKGYAFAIASVVVSSIIATLVALSAFITIGPTLGVGTLALWAYALSRIVPRLKRLKDADVGTFNPTPLYLVIVPMTTTLLQQVLAGPAVEFSRNRAIINSSQFIDHIEQYKRRYGHYPPSLLAEHKDYDPGVIGIKEFHYEPHGEAYNVFFEQLTFRFGTQEFVMYNPRDEQVLASHDSDRLLWTPAEQAARPGYYAVHDASRPHWKYFWFD